MRTESQFVDVVPVVSDDAVHVANGQARITERGMHRLVGQREFGATRILGVVGLADADDRGGQALLRATKKVSRPVHTTSPCWLTMSHCSCTMPPVGRLVLGRTLSTSYRA